MMQEAFYRAGWFQRERVRSLLTELQEVNGEIHQVYNIRDAAKALSQNGKEKLESLNRTKTGRILELLKLRADGHAPDVKVTIFQYPSESLHPFSRNELRIDYLDPDNPKRPCFTRFFLDKLAEANRTDSKTVMAIIGQPDFFDRELLREYLQRTFHEIEHVDTARQEAVERKELGKVQELRELRGSLVGRYLYFWVKRHAYPTSSIQITVGLSSDGGGPENDIIRVSVEDGKRNYFVELSLSLYSPLTQQRLQTLFRRGGYDYVTPPGNQSIPYSH